MRIACGAENDLATDYPMLDWVNGFCKDELNDVFEVSRRTPMENGQMLQGGKKCCTRIERQMDAKLSRWGTRSDCERSNDHRTQQKAKRSLPQNAIRKEQSCTSHL